MTDSVDRKYKGGATKEEVAKLRELPQKNNADRTKPSDLPNWAKVALVKRELFGLTWDEAAKEFNRTGATLNNYGKSPIGHEIRDKVSSFRDDPVAVSKALLAANALSVTLDRLAFLEWAKEARDYTTGDKIAADLQDRIGITKKSSKNDQPMNLTITLQGGNLVGSFEVPTVEAEFEELDDVPMLESGE